MKFLKEAADLRAYNRVKNRLEPHATPTVKVWADSALWATQEGLEHAQDRAALVQARTNTIALLAAVDSLLDRTP